MTSESKDVQKAASADETAQAPSVRRAYHAPVLRRLGSVRELTLGTGRGNADGNRTGNGKGM